MVPAKSGKRLGEHAPLSGFMPGVLRLVGTIVGAFVPRNFRSSYREGAKLKIKTQGVLLNFFSKVWTLTVYSIYYVIHSIYYRV